MSPINYQKTLAFFKKSYKVKTINQSNYYYDTKDLFLKKNGTSFRVRIKGNKAIVGLKESLGGTSGRMRKEKKDGLFNRNEYYCTFTDGMVTANKILAQKISLFKIPYEKCKVNEGTTIHPILALKRLLKKYTKRITYRNINKRVITVSKLKLLGGNQTVRSVVSVILGGVDYNLELDRTTFPMNYLSFELEMEVPSNITKDRVIIQRELENYLKNIVKVKYFSSAYSKSSLLFKVLRKEDIPLLLKNHFLYK